MAAAATAAASGLLGTLTFSPSASANDSFKLFSFPDSLQQSLREGASLQLVGIDGDDLTLCTAGETYSVAMVETSNALLLVRPGDASGLVVEGQLRGVHELKRVVPGVHRVREALEEEEWGDKEGGITARRRGRPAAPTAGGALRVEVAASRGAGADADDDFEPRDEGDAEGEAALRDMQEAEEEEEEEESTMAIDVEGPQAAVLREAALAALPFRPGPLDAQLPAPRPARGWALDELCAVVQASRCEVAAELARLGAVAVDAAAMPPRFSLLTPAYMAQVLRDACGAMKDEGWAPENAILSAIARKCSDRHRATIVAHVVRLHSTASAASPGADAGAAVAAALAHPPLAGSVALSWEKVAVRIGEETLAKARDAAERRPLRGGAHIAASEFERTWAGEVDGIWPSGGLKGEKCHLDLLQCRGLVLLDATPPAPASLRYFPEAELPHEPAKRFKALFAARAVWTEAELTPFLMPIVLPPHRKLSDLLATFSRVSINAGRRTFSAR